MAIENGNSLDKLKSGKTHVKRTKFPINGKLFNTYRFGEYGVTLGFNGIASDKLSIRAKSSVDSYTLKAPLMSDIFMNKAYFQVPRQAIIPNLWEKIFTNPSIGEDVDAKNVGTSVDADSWRGFLNNLAKALYIFTYKGNFDTDGTMEQRDLESWFNYFVRIMTWNEYVYSHGSMLNALGAKFSNLWKKRSYDSIYEELWNEIGKQIGAIYVGYGENYNNVATVFIPGNTLTEAEKETIALGNFIMPFQMYLSMLRDGDDIIATAFYGNDAIVRNATQVYTDAGIFKDLIEALNTFRTNNFSTSIANGWEKPIDIAPLWAYQLVCAEFYTNDKVDYIYNAELYRQYIKNLYFVLRNTKTVPTTSVNGIDIELDALGATIFKSFAAQVSEETIIIDDYINDYWRVLNAYFAGLFNYKRSLRYKDYFTGARTRPLGIGDTDVEVVGGDHVEIIDVSRNIQKQRFLNVINKIPRTLKGYTKGIFGKDVAPDWHNPLFLGLTKTAIFGTETENTGVAQMTEPVSRTSTLTGEGKYQFNVELDRNSIIIGIVYFDIERAYSQGCRRYFFDVDRFDMFNPYLQYTGDQPVYKEEYRVTQNGTFGYQGAYMHMKQAVTEASGGFIENLKGWTFLDQYESESYVEPDHISPDFIRSRPYELDKFYISLNGNSLANYFHFIVKENVIIEANRPMALDPQILG